MGYQSEMMVNLELSIELFEYFVIELMTIICNYSSGSAKFAYDAFSYEISGFELGYLGYKPSLYPFSKIINWYK